MTPCGSRTPPRPRFSSVIQRRFRFRFCAVPADHGPVPFARNSYPLAIAWLALALTLTFGVSGGACGGSGQTKPCAAGGERCACYGNGTCNVNWSGTFELCSITCPLGEHDAHASCMRDQAVGFRLIDGRCKPYMVFD